jgi:hypothetical protein
MAMKAPKDGKMSVLVSSSNYIYSHFRHISGVRAPEGVRGVAINRIKTLDVLIEQVKQGKKQKELASAPVSDEQTDALIKPYEDQSSQTISTGTALPYTAPTAPVGLMFDVIA